MKSYTIQLFIVLFLISHVSKAQDSFFRASTNSEFEIDEETREAMTRFTTSEDKTTNINRSYVFNIEEDIFNKRTISFQIEGTTISASLLKQNVRGGNGDFTWFGKTSNGQGIFFRIKNGSVVSYFSINGFNYVLTPVSGKNKMHILYEVADNDEHNECGTIGEVTRERVPSIPPPLPSLDDENCTLRLLVATTPSVRNARTDFEIRNRINTRIDYANMAYILSGIDLTVELAVLVSTNYQEVTTSSGDGNIFQDLTNFRNGSGVLQIVHEYRERYQTDLNMLLTNTDTPGSDGMGTIVGLANGLQGAPFLTNAARGFSVLGQNAFVFGTNVTTFTHELGHNQGAFHDNNSPNPSFARGFRSDASSESTIMAVFQTGFSRIQYFSNPNISVSGVTIGTSSRNNARRLNNTGRFIRGYRIVPVNNNLDNEIIPSGFISNHLGKNTVSTTGSTITYRNGSVGEIRASEEVILSPGITIESGSEFRAYIDRESCLVNTRSNIEVEVPSSQVLDETIKTVSLFPNPAQDILHIESDEDIIGIEIMSQIGVLKERRESFIDPRKGEFDVSRYKTGIYFIVITFKDGSTLNKTMIKK
ncbi:M12 family metallo-peptidase [uncultured Dokdonia sp.]|uniref:M12 family metallo-peptidase n=1 Tax=uncultured Dokdonia sp. TaxID=575653 RepID=UPI00261A199E|nr:M12 family metallo-peptidase [uncultured Dokdonia sp.]